MLYFPAHQSQAGRMRWLILAGLWLSYLSFGVVVASLAPLEGGGFRLYVHSADVAHFVETGGVLDDEAQARGTSVYFPGIRSSMR